MQKRPNQVQSCTGARSFIVRGIARMASTISRTIPAKPSPLAFMARKASVSSGGYSLVVKIVQSTAPRKATEPT
jgi:hypothetical protein